MRRGWLKPRWTLGLLIVLTASVYTGALDNSFHYDDFHAIVNNPAVRSLDSIPNFFVSASLASEERHARNYRPLLYTSYALNYAAAGFSPVGFHLVNLLLHLLSVSLLYVLVFRVSGRSDMALLAAAIFALHPMNAEAVNYITARSSVLSSLLMLSSLLCFIRYRGSLMNAPRQAAGRSWFYYGASLLFMFLAFLSKETAWVLPAFFLLYDVCFFFTASRKSLYEAAHAYLPILLIFGLGLWVRTELMGGGPVLAVPSEKLSMAFLTSLHLFRTYLFLMVWPHPLSIEHDLGRVQSLSEPGVLLSLTVVSALLLIGLAAFRFSRWVSFCIFWFFLSLGPLAYLPFFTNVALFQENRGYMAVMAFSVFLAWVFVGGWRSKDAVKNASGRQVGAALKWAFICLLLVSYGMMDISRNRAWADDLSLWSDAVKKAPQSVTAHYNLGLAYQKAGRWEESIGKIQQLLQARPDYPKAHYNLGLAFTMTGRLALAEAAYQEAIRVKPRDSRAYYNLGVIYLRQGRLEAAQNAYEEALKMDPNLAEAHNNLGQVYERLGRRPAAIQAYLSALKVKPSYAKARHNLGLAYQRAGRLAQAEQAFRQLIVQTPGDAEAHARLGSVYEQQDRWDLAVKAYRRALELNPSLVGVQARLDRGAGLEQRDEKP